MLGTLQEIDSRLSSLRHAAHGVGGGRPKQGEKPFSIGGISAGPLLNHLIRQYDAKAEKVGVKWYPSGVQISTVGNPFRDPPRGVSRGLVQGMSNESRRRFCAAFISLHVPDYKLLAVTLTTHAKMSQIEFRACLKRFYWRMTARGWAGFWRPELQIRGAPHAHMAMWVPQHVEGPQIASVWLEVTGEYRDAAAVQYAVMVRCLPVGNDEAGWAIYMAKHDSKESEGQGGWLGRSWGIVNRKVMVERKPAECTLNKPQHFRLLRMILRHQNSLRRRDLEKAKQACRVAKDSFVVEKVHIVNFRLVEFGKGKLAVFDGDTFLGMSLGNESAIPEERKYLRLRKVLRPLRKMHGGNLQRLLPGEIVGRMVAFVVAADAQNPF